MILDFPNKSQFGSDRVQDEYMGFVVEVVHEHDGTPYPAAYRLHGKRGAVYSLCRYDNVPHLMFVRNSRGNISAIHGNGYFSDKSGRLVAQSTQYA